MAVYTKLTFDEIKNLTDQYPVGELKSARGIEEGSENSNYLLTTEKAKYILTVYEKRTHKNDLPFFLELTEYLSNSHLPAPIPLHAKNGDILQSVKDKNCALISFLEGKSVDEISVSNCFEVGKILARMHLATSGFPLSRANDMGLKSWRELHAKINPRLHETKTVDAAKLSEQLSLVEKSWPENLPAGVIHADLFPDNVFFTSEKLTGLIDFYFACNDFFSYDLAITMNAWCFEDNGELNKQKASAMFKGYQEFKKLSAEELTAMPILFKGAALRFLLTRLYDWLNPKGDLAKRRDPLEYWKKLQYHMRFTDLEQYRLFS